MNTVTNVNPDLPHDYLNDGRMQRIWDAVSRSPLRSLWNMQGVSFKIIVRRTTKAVFADRLFGRAAELGFYFLFALFPTLLSASSLLGLAARSADQIYYRLLHYLALVIPTAALGTVLKTFNETTAAATPGKLTFGLIAAIWSASVGVSAIQDALNQVYKVQDTRSYVRARIYAIGLTIVLTMLFTLMLSAMLGGDVIAGIASKEIHERIIAVSVGTVVRLLGWICAVILLAISFALIYYCAPDVKKHRWHWVTPGSTLGILGWLVASLGLRLYLHFFNQYSLTYGSLGAVIILLTWFYITGLMLLLGAELNCEIEASVTELQLEGRLQNAPPSEDGAI